MPETLEELKLKPFLTEPTEEQVVEEEARQERAREFVERDVPGVTPVEPSISQQTAPPITQPITPEVQPTLPTTPDPVGDIIDRKAKSLDIILPDPIREKLKDSIRRTNNWGLLFEAISSVGDVLAGTPGQAQAYHGALREKRKAALGEYDTERFNDPLSNVSQKYQLVADEYYPQMDWNKYSAKEITALYPMLKDLLAKQEAKITSEKAVGRVKEAKRSKSEESLRRQYLALPITKSSMTISSSIEKLKAAHGDDSPAGDIALIFGYMKILDPPSVVREGEFATAENTSNVPDKIRRIYNKLLTGERLTPRQRDFYLKSGQSAADAHMSKQKVVDGSWRKLSEKQGINPDYVVMDLGFYVSALDEKNKKRLQELRKKAKE